MNFVLKPTILRSTDDGDHHENGMEEPAEDFSTFKKAVSESICHQKDQSNVDRNEMTSKYPRIISREISSYSADMYKHVIFTKLIDLIDPFDPLYFIMNENN